MINGGLKWLVLLLMTMCMCMSESLAQQETPFAFDEYRMLVKSNHPYIRISELQKSKGENTLRRARGNFDPKLEASFSNKEFQRKDYYRLTSATLKIPTAAAVELKAGFDLNTGEYVSGEILTPDDGLFIAGLSLPLVQGLMMDERRTALAQAKAFNLFSLYEQEVIRNDLLLKAFSLYYDWWAAHEKKKIAEDILRVAEERFDAVRDRALAGQAPFIDTVEANIQLLMRRQNVQDFRLNEIKSRMAVSTFVWDDRNEASSARVITEDFVPRLSAAENIFNSYVMQNFLALHDSIVVYNPYLAQFDPKLTAVEADERMKREKLKPKINLNYNMLAEGMGSTREDVNFSPNNYKWGIDFSFPLLLRTERGDLALTRIKLAETKLDQQLKVQEVKNKARYVYEGMFLLRSQIEIAENNIANYRQLLEGERTKFFNGESSLFLMNQRELQLVDAQNKLIDLRLKLFQTYTELSFLLGVID